MSRQGEEAYFTPGHVLLFVFVVKKYPLMNQCAADFRLKWLEFCCCSKELRFVNKDNKVKIGLATSKIILLGGYRDVTMLSSKQSVHLQFDALISRGTCFFTLIFLCLDGFFQA